MDSYIENISTRLPNSFPPQVWGKYWWSTLYDVVFAMPSAPSKEVVDSYVDFFEALRYAIPCSQCRHDYAEFIETDSPTEDTLGTRKSAIMWLVRYNNHVNSKTGTPPISPEYFVKNILQNYSDCESADTIGNAVGAAGAPGPGGAAEGRRGCLAAGLPGHLRYAL